MSDGRVHVGASTIDVMSGNMDIMAGVAARVISHSILMMERSPKQRARERGASNGSTLPSLHVLFRVHVLLRSYMYKHSHALGNGLCCKCTVLVEIGKLKISNPQDAHGNSQSCTRKQSQLQSGNRWLWNGSLLTRTRVLTECTVPRRSAPIHTRHATLRLHILLKPHGR